MTIFIVLIGAALLSGTMTLSALPAYEHLKSDLLHNSQDKESYNILKKLADGNKCLKDAAQIVLTSCTMSNQDELKKQALAFTNCHLLESGRIPQICDQKETLQECLKKLDNEAYTTYTMFFLHADNVCFFYRSMVWFEQSELLINKITSMLPEITDIMSQNYLKIQDIFDIQAEIEKWTRLSANETSESFGLLDEKIMVGLRKILGEIEAYDGRFLSIIGKLQTLDNLMLFNYANLEILVFYFGAFFFTLFITCYTRFADIRLRLHLTLMANYLLEQGITYSLSYVISHETLKLIIHYERFLCVAITLKIIYIQYKRYKDPSKLLLNAIRDVVYSKQKDDTNKMRARTAVFLDENVDFYKNEPKE